MIIYYFKLRYHDNAILVFTIFTHFPLKTLSKMLDNKKFKNDMHIRFLFMEVVKIMNKTSHMQYYHKNTF